jgi:cbb3-type cytochrome oxidase cytochrome c subunit
MSGFTHPEYIVSTAWLADHLDDPQVRVATSNVPSTSRSAP